MEELETLQELQYSVLQYKRCEGREGICSLLGQVVLWERDS